MKVVDAVRQRLRPTRPHATFRDAEIEQRFEHEGYVVVDLLPQPSLDRLRDGYGELDHRHDPDSPFAAGFHTTLYDDRRPYREQVRSLFERELGPALDELLVDHQIILANFVVKLAGGEDVPHHLDWTFLDENRFRSATVWCPLEDVTARGGALGLAPGSHRRVDFVRAVNHRHYDQHADLLDDRRDGVVLDLRAGQAVVMDNRVVHFSPPNRSDGTRVAAAAVVTPRTAALHHYWVDDDNNLIRFTVSPDFYLSYIPGHLPRAADGILTEEPVRDQVYR